MDVVLSVTTNAVQNDHMGCFNTEYTATNDVVRHRLLRLLADRNCGSPRAARVARAALGKHQISLVYGQAVSDADHLRYRLQTSCLVPRSCCTTLALSCMLDRGEGDGAHRSTACGSVTAKWGATLGPNQSRPLTGGHVVGGRSRRADCRQMTRREQSRHKSPFGHRRGRKSEDSRIAG